MQLPARHFSGRFFAAHALAQQQLIAAVDIRRIQQRRRKIQRLQMLAQAFQHRLVDQIGLAQQQPVRRRDLCQPLRMQSLLQRRVTGIHQRDDQTDMKAPAQLRVVAQRGENRGRVGQAGGLQNDPAKRRNFTSITPLQKTEQRVFQLTADGAADTTAGQQHGIRCDLFNQQMIDTHVAEFVDQQRGVAHVFIGQQAFEQRGLATAEEAGNHVQGNAHDDLCK